MFKKKKIIITSLNYHFLSPYLFNKSRNFNYYRLGWTCPIYWLIFLEQTINHNAPQQRFLELTISAGIKPSETFWDEAGLSSLVNKQFEK